MQLLRQGEGKVRDPDRMRDKARSDRVLLHPMQHSEGRKGTGTSVVGGGEGYPSPPQIIPKIENYSGG